MTMIDQAAATKVSRRGFLGGAAGLTFALSLPGFLVAEGGAALAQGAAGPKPIGAWVSIAPDGAIVLAIPTAEMGQGSLTALPMIVAEELDADWSRVSTIYPPVVPGIYGNPMFGGQMVTYGSGAIRGYWDKIRLQAAAARRVLMQAAADKWAVPLADIHTEPSAVVHAASNRRLSYGEIAGFATVPATMPTIDKSELKKTADYRIIGKATPRFDIPDKTTGAAKYGIDAQVPNMVYATLLHAPVDRATPDHVDDSAALAVPGVLKVIPLDHAIAVVAETVEAAFAGLGALKVTWSSMPADAYGSVAGQKEFLARAANLGDKGASFLATGDVDGIFAKAAKTMTAQYTTDYVYHAGMEPMNATAAIDPAGNGAEIWLGTQGPGPNVLAAAKMLKTTPNKIKHHQFYLGGGYGRRSPPDLMFEVLPLAKAMQRPVKMIWTRDQDVKTAKMRPMTGHQIEAALDANGKVVGWRHRVVAESIIVYGAGEKVMQFTKGLDNIVLEGSKHEYGIPNQSIAYLRENRGVGLSSWRGIGAGYNKFVIESFIDEIATAQKVDPVQFRLGLLQNEPRAQAVIKAVADKAGWGKPVADGHALGFAYAKVVETYVAAIGEISVDEKTGIIRAHKFWVALDPGIVINPDSVLAQTEGNVIFGLSQTLKERVSIVDGKVQQNNYYDYPVLRMAEMPEIDIQIIATDNPPKGMGEATLPLISPVVGNALYKLTGKRMRALPMSPARVKAGLTIT
ncbi:MAG TPA: molybdopterin cofactor-binding domain-containing protein [Stellaceae bacterium]|nr:molybdopterin cofactor-binding domain-containing protein [Stellaceae bacterium]